MRVCLIGLVIVLTGCVSPLREARMERDAKRCEEYGFTPGTDAYAQCRMQSDIEHKRASREMGEDVGNAVKDAYSRPTAPPSANCMSRQSYPGAPVYTTCS